MPNSTYLNPSEEELQILAREHAAKSEHAYAQAAAHNPTWNAHDWVISALRAAYKQGADDCRKGH